MLSRWSRSQSGVIVDYGCGESPFREWFPGARSYVRMDIEPRGRGSVVVGRSLLPARRESVDCVLLFQVLGDVEDPREFLGEIYRALRPGGHVLVFETMSYPEHDLPRDYFRVMPAGLEWVATSVGFRGLEVVRLGGLFTRISQLWNTFLMGRLRSWPLTAWIGVGGTVLMNLAAVALDKVLPHPALASDYLARLEK
ncbi:MAG TPA: methyltransferase domain-containing protein [Thermoanaerobaculia bacterium]|nr:methyltransferase domain-containing protein [Thermoanaerobaculia bacterium]